MQLLHEWWRVFRRYKERDEKRIVIEGGPMCVWTIINAAFQSPWRERTCGACRGFACLLQHKRSHQISRQQHAAGADLLALKYRCKSNVRLIKAVVRESEY